MIVGCNPTIVGYNPIDENIFILVGEKFIHIIIQLYHPSFIPTDPAHGWCKKNLCCTLRGDLRSWCYCPSLLRRHWWGQHLAMVMIVMMMSENPMGCMGYPRILK